MFWLLKGATRRPSCRKMRHSAVASRLLPAPDIVPCTIMQRAIYTTSPSACKKALFSEWVRTAARYHPGPRPG